MEVCREIGMPVSLKKTVWACTLMTFLGFLGGLSLHLNHLIASRVGICYRQFGTLPI